MKPRYILAPEAARDLVQIWRYINREAGHRRRDLTSAEVRFFPVYSYLIVYRPETKPLEIVTILHGRRDVAAVLREIG